MKPKYLCIVAVLFMLEFGLLASSASFAQTYPNRPIQVIPYGAGGNSDIAGRLFIQELEKVLRTKIIANNRPGGLAGVLGTDFVARAKNDGYTLLYTGSSPLVIVPVTNPEIVHYDPAKDLEPLGLHFLTPCGFNVRLSAPWKTFPEIIDYAKKNPKKLRLQALGVGHSTHFLMEVMASQTGVQFTHVPDAEGGETVITAVLGGHVEGSCDAFAKQVPHIEAGKIRSLLVSNKVPSFPDIPTITEFGYKQDLPGSWLVVCAPARIPEAVKQVLVPAVEKAVKNTKSKIEDMGNVLAYKSPAEFRKMWELEYKQTLEVATRLNVRKK